MADCTDSVAAWFVTVQLTQTKDLRDLIYSPGSPHLRAILTNTIAGLFTRAIQLIAVQLVHANSPPRPEVHASRVLG
jgi:hypothetical protein